jgi:hypothetical protein
MMSSTNDTVRKPYLLGSKPFCYFSMTHRLQYQITTQTESTEVTLTQRSTDLENKITSSIR